MARLPPNISADQLNPSGSLAPEGNVLVTGATGFVGRALCAEMVRRGISVRAAVRKETDAARLTGCEQVRIEGFSDATSWSSAMRGVSTVFHLAARVHVMREDVADPWTEFHKVNVAATECLARQAVACGVRRFVFVSSIKVNGEMTRGDERFSESDPPSPRDDYGRSKWEAEQVLWRIAEATGLEVVVVRPPLVYGPAVKGNFATMLKVLRRGLPLPLASVSNLRSLIYVGNLADALILCATHPAASRQTYVLSDGEDLSTPDLLRRLGRAIGKPASLLPCPPGLLELAGKLVGKRAPVERLLGSLRVDDGKIRRELGWSPPHSLSDGLRATAEWVNSQ